jgi:hypothetical protein
LIAVHTGISVTAFDVNPKPVIVGEDAVFSWTTSHLDGLSMTCTFGVRGEGVNPISIGISSCNGPQVVDGTFGRPGQYTATLTVTAASGVGTTRSMPVEVRDGNGADTFSGEIASLPTGNWRVTILYPSLLDPTATSFNAIGDSAPLTNGAFDLDITPITPPPVPLVTPNLPPTTTLNPANTAGATFSFIAFNDTNNNQRLDAGETLYEINDPANTFGIGALILEYADRPYTITGTSQTSTGTTVNWNVTSAGNWGRRIDRTTTAGTEVEITHDNRLTNLQLTPGRQGTIGTAGITTLTTPTTPTPQGIFNQP